MFGNRKTRLTHEGWYFLIVLSFIVVAGSMRQINLMLVMAGMMVGAIYFNWHIARSMLRRLQIRRRLPREIGAGDTLVVDLEISSRQRCTALLVSDAIRRVAQPHLPENDVKGIVAVPHVAPGRPTHGQYRVVFDERGRYEFGPFWVETRHPFGLVARAVRFRRPARLLVLPKLGRLTDRWTHLAQKIDYGSHQSAGQQRPTDGEFYGLRDWQPGDSRRLIHWRTSARRGGLMVRQFEQPRNENLTLLVELWQPDRANSRGPRTGGAGRSLRRDGDGRSVPPRRKPIVRRDGRANASRPPRRSVEVAGPRYPGPFGGRRGKPQRSAR